MSSLYNKYRPQEFSTVLGQDYTVAVLKNSVELNKISHAYLFAGPKGTGKTTLARIFAKAVNCEKPKKGEPCGKCKSCQLVVTNQNLDIVEIDAASHMGVDDVRELKENINTSPSALKYKVYIIDEAHMLSKGAFNALLKSLEEPPNFVIFILATTEIHKIPPTIISRCQHFDFKRITNRQIVDKLSIIAQKEKIKVSRQALMQIATASEGGMRDAESLFDQIINLDQDKRITSKEVRDILGTPNAEKFHSLIQAMADKDARKGFQIITELAYGGYDIKNYLENLINYSRDILILKINPVEHKKLLIDKLTKENFGKLVELTEELELNFIGKMIAELIMAKNLVDDSPLPHLPLELALVKIIGADNIDNTSSSKSKIENKNKNGGDNGKSNKISKVLEKKVVESSAKVAKKRVAKKMVKRAVGKVIEKAVKLVKDKPSVKKVAKDIPKNSEKSFKDKKVSKKFKKKETFDLTEINKAWPKIVKGLKTYNYSLWGIIQNCQPVGIDETGEILIEVRYDFYKAKLMEIENKKLIVKVAKEILDLDCSFCYLLKDEIPPEFRKQEKKEGKAVAQELLNEFGGEMV
ncbi:MAG: DNA polymerase III subunit gamma/tau [Patescibacteria group bacterium]|nr:DNA polymerase III subunit gamma/tau [Patescibacteria group bacterium]